jgi:ubiquinone/menaquinone biosynthesis C-methylase UbiE
MRASMSRGRAALDVGCGTGLLAARLAAAFAGARVAGVDPSAAMIRRAGAARAGSGAGFVTGCAEELPFAGSVFDLVVVTLSMSHWCDMAAGLGQIRRVMAPGATLVAAETVPRGPARPGPARRGGAAAQACRAG